MTLPNFMVIGAAKAGTTSLYHYLKQHPQIYMSPVKETNFFSLEGHPLDFSGPGDQTHICSFTTTTIEKYRTLFEAADSERAVGEASPMYLYSERAPANIASYVPKVKLIAMLRDPAQRAFSQYLYFLSDQREPLTDFAQAVAQCEQRRRAGWEWAWQYIDVGFYGRQLSRYFDLFAPGQIRVYIYRDFCRAPIETMQDIYRFLEVDDSFVPDTSTRHNLSKIPRSKRLGRFVAEPNPVEALLKRVLPLEMRRAVMAVVTDWNTARPTLQEDVRRRLIELYREDILRLQDLIHRDVSHWLEMPQQDLGSQ